MQRILTNSVQARCCGIDAMWHGTEGLHEFWRFCTTLCMSGSRAPPMKSAVKNPIRIALVENDPLRSVGFRALFDADPDFEVQSCTSTSIFGNRNFDLVLIGSRT